jgi:dolichyl-phosphate beta-glucosyltransferase
MQEVCIVIPCYNEEQRLPGDDLLSFLEAEPSITLCVVNDGSTDGTLAALERLRQRCPERIVVCNLAHNRGKAEAVRAGVQHVASTGTWPFIGYWDADLSTPLSESSRLLAALKEAPDCWLALGSRVKRLGSNIERQASRHILGRVFATCASSILGFPVYDSQCGAKLFRAATVGVFFEEPFLTRWLFDLEMLVRLRNQCGPRAVDMAREVPLQQWREVRGSKLKLRDMFRVPRELMMIRRHYNRRRS